ncbi:hypothetical protein H6P81_021595 [Aristolochia fimbriata]|uniref:Uncharacterized protein n=1 Tax=Aristolochia fimbriata TaxID=158543 RepID=A0AAV7DSD1_ARIFI|nr:hypothetical protein H6P81_021595 [Aristolochia fimbriata]
MAWSTSSMKIKNFLPISLHYLWKQTRFGPRFHKNGSTMKSMAMVDFFIENKGTFFPYHYITYGNRHALSQIPMEMGHNEIHGYGRLYSLKNKGTFFPYHYITYGNRHALVQIAKKMVDNEIHGYGRILSLKIKELSSHIITLPMETNTLWSQIPKWVDNEIHGYGRLSSLKNKGKLQLKQQDIINHTKSRKRNFLPISLHYLWKQTRFGPYSAKWVDNEIHGYGRLSSLKIKELSSHIITLPMETDTLWSQILLKWVDNEIHGYGRLSSLKIKELSSHIITLPMETDTLLVQIQNGSIMKSMAMVDFLH